MGKKKPNRRRSGDPSKRIPPPARRPILGPSGFDYSQFPPEAADRRSQAEYLIDNIRHGTPDGRVDPAISENLRHHLAENPGDPERALLNHSTSRWQPRECRWMPCSPKTSKRTAVMTRRTSRRTTLGQAAEVQVPQVHGGAAA